MADLFRQEYKKLNEDQLAVIQSIKGHAQDLFIEFISARKVCEVDEVMLVLAQHKLEEAVMWAVKAIT